MHRFSGHFSDTGPERLDGSACLPERGKNWPSQVCSLLKSNSKMVDQKVYIPVLLKPQKIYAENGEIQECTGTDKVGPILLSFHKQYFWQCRGQCRKSAREWGGTLHNSSSLWKLKSECYRTRKTVQPQTDLLYVRTIQYLPTYLKGKCHQIFETFFK